MSTTNRFNSYDDIQAAVAEWQVRNFGESPLWQLVLGVAEEVGEFHAADDWPARIDAIGDVGVYVAAACARVGVPGFTLGEMAARSGGARYHQGISVCVGQACRTILKNTQGIRGYDDPKVFREGLWHSLCGVVRHCHSWLQACPVDELRDYPRGYLDVVGSVATKVLRRDWRARPGDANRVSHCPVHNVFFDPEQGPCDACLAAEVSP